MGRLKRILKTKFVKIILFSIIIVFVLILGVGFWQAKKIEAERAKDPLFKKFAEEDKLLDLKLKILSRKASSLELVPLEELPLITTSSMEKLVAPMLEEDFRREAEKLSKEVEDYVSKNLERVKVDPSQSDENYLAMLRNIDNFVNVPQTGEISEWRDYFQKLLDALLAIRPSPKYLGAHKLFVSEVSLKYYIINEIEKENTNQIRKMMLLKFGENLLSPPSNENQ
jgi:hypothetical protein